MTTSSLNATIGIMGIHYSLRDAQMGWTLHVVSLTDSGMTLRLAVHNNNNPIYFLTVCYLVSQSPLLDINFIEYTFSMSDPTQMAANRSATAPSITPRSATSIAENTSTSRPYPPRQAEGW